VQNKYVGDIGDYCKLGLLRYLSGAFQRDCEAPFSLGVGWYVVPDHFDPPSNRDGRHISYLGLEHHQDRIIDHPDSALLEHLDPFLWAHLRKTVHEGKRKISELESALVPGIGNRFHAEPLPVDIPSRERERSRRIWLESMLSTIGSRDLLFLDPDNGLASEKVRVTSKGVVKHLLFDELRRLCEVAGIGLVFYHHLGRHAPHSAQISTLKARLQRLGDEWSISQLVFNRNTSRAFFMLVRRNHDAASELESRFASFVEAWRRPGGAVAVPETH
jgi:hypothetical protein